MTLVSVPKPGTAALGHRHAIADAGLGERVGRIPGVIPLVAVQLLDEGMQELQVARVVRPPHPLQQALVGQHPSGSSASGPKR